MITPLSRHHQHGPTFPVEKLHDGWNLGPDFRPAFRDIEDARITIATYFGIAPHLVRLNPLDVTDHFVFTVLHDELGGAKTGRLYYFAFKVDAGDPPPFVPLFTPLITTVPISKGKKSWAKRLTAFILRRPATQQ